MTSPSTDRRYGLNASVALKAPCRAATTANITLNGTQTIDGIAVVAGDRVLVKNQTDQTTNGIYVVDTGDWYRDYDCNGNNDLVAGTLVMIMGGSAVGAVMYRQTTVDPVIGTSNIVWTINTNALTGVTAYAATLLAAGNQAALAALIYMFKPTRQVFLSGSGATYTRPTNCTKIVVRMKGPGGSTRGSSTSADGGAAGAGTATSFNSVTAAVGGNGEHSAGGKSSSGSGGTGGTGTASVRIAGAMGHTQTTPYATATNAYVLGGQGGGEGGGYTKDPVAYGTASGSAGVANSGGGASGAGLSTSGAFAGVYGIWASGGGGEGEYVELIIDSPAATYLYTVGTAGTAGTAGTGGVVGAAGGSGVIIVDEYYGVV